MLHDTEISSIADRLVMALTSGDMAEMQDLMAPEFSMSHNFSRQRFNRSETVAYLDAFFAQFTDLRYTQVLRMFSPDGFVQQHIVLTSRDDAEPGLPACFVVRIAKGKITQLDEYLDGSQIYQNAT